VRAQVSHALGEYQVVVWMSRESETFDDCPLIFVTRSELSLSDEARFGERAAHRLISLSLRANPSLFHRHCPIACFIIVRVTSDNL
jgi:hypothetical protein